MGARSMFDTLLNIIISIIYIVWFSVGVYLIFNTSHMTITNPRNSRGDVCGIGAEYDKPYLLYLDISECAGIEQINGVCSSTQICISKCPQTYWTYSMGKSPGLEQFCDNLNNETKIPIAQLVAEKICPPYILPSKSVMGMCIPQLIFGEKNVRDVKKINTIKINVDGDTLDINALIEGVNHEIRRLDKYDFNKKIQPFIVLYWWNIIITYTSVIFFTFIFTLIFKLYPFPLICSTFALFPLLLLYVIIITFMNCVQMSNINNNTIPTIITSMTSFKVNINSYYIFGTILCIIFPILCIMFIYFASCIKEGVNLIIDAIKNIKCIRSALFILSIQSITQTLIILWMILVSTSIASTPKLKYNIVNSCLSETCINPLTGKMFTLYDTCDPLTFGDCTGCARTQCVFNTSVNDTSSSVLQCWNLLCMIVILLHIKCIISSLMYEIITRDIETENLISILREIYNRYKNSAQIIFFSMNNLSSKYIYQCVTNKAKCSIYIIFIVKLFVIGILSVFTFSVIFNQMYYTLDSYINYHVAFLLLIFLSIYIIVSEVLNIFKIAVEIYEAQIE